MSKIPSPAVTTETAQFWSKANEGQLSVPQCRSCGKFHWYPRAHCPFCTSHQVELKTASGRGTIYTFSVSRRGKDSYVIAYVTLDEGVTMMTNIVNGDAAKLAIGQPVRLAMVESENGQRVPMFEPA
jgi:uncharacterized OB-fold protein